MDFNEIMQYALMGLALLYFASRIFGGGGPTATASHILVKDPAKAEELLKDLEVRKGWFIGLKGEELKAGFAALAKQYSTCPSGKSGGSLGSFSRGQMVPAFDKASFEGPVGEVQVVPTGFGTHLVLVHEREEPGKDGKKKE